MIQISEQPQKRTDVPERRIETKYVVSPHLIPQIRQFIQPFCQPDGHAVGNPPEYVVNTLQLDSPSLSLWRAVEQDAENRFKLRVRTYGNHEDENAILEVKRKIRRIVVKSRAVIPVGQWGRDLLFDPRAKGRSVSSWEEDQAFLDFVRLAQQIDARPVVSLRYVRESYFSVLDPYARVTMDRQIVYRPARSWKLASPDDRYFKCDVAGVMGRPHSGVVLELKCLEHAPLWMVELVRCFSLSASSVCKYGLAMAVESEFGGYAIGRSGEHF